MKLQPHGNNYWSNLFTGLLLLAMHDGTVKQHELQSLLTTKADFFLSIKGEQRQPVLIINVEWF